MNSTNSTDSTSQRINHQSAKITVLIPIYLPNIDFLRQSIYSCCVQTLSHSLFKVLLIFDGDPGDNIIEIAKSSFFNNIDFNILVHSHQGLTATLNFGLSVISTKYVARLDCDDIMLPSRLQKQLDLIEARDDVAVVGSRLVYINSNNRLENPLFNYPVHPVFVDLIGALFNNPLAHPSVIFRLSLIKALGGYQSQPPVEDYHLWSRLSPCFAIINLSESLTYYRKHSDQITKTTNRSYRQFCSIRFNFLNRLISSYPIFLLFVPFFIIILFIPVTTMRYVFYLFVKKSSK